MRAATRILLPGLLSLAAAGLPACEPHQVPGGGQASALEPRAQPAAARSPEGAGRLPYFDALQLEPGAISASVTGVDPQAPRALGLWRSRAGGGPLRLLQVGASDPAGHFDFGQVLVPLDGLELLVAPIDAPEPAAAPSASRIVLALPAQP